MPQGPHSSVSKKLTQRQVIKLQTKLQSSHHHSLPYILSHTHTQRDTHTDTLNLCMSKEELLLLSSETMKKH